MARTPSTMLALGTEAPDFNLVDVVSEQEYNLDKAYGDNGLLVMFICNHCPFVIHLHDAIQEVSKYCVENNIGVVAINSNDVENYPDDSPEKMKELATKLGFDFPYLFDESQEAAKNYQAACTPDFYLFDHKTRLFYRGQMDDSRPGNDVEVTGKDLLAAINALLDGAAKPEPQKPSLGCNIKWKAGNEPEYFSPKK